MANMIGYELLVVGSSAIGPTASTVSGANSVCAIFYVDPDSPCPVRYRGDAAPTASFGLPLAPGKHLVVAGKGGIMNAQFVSRDGRRCTVHACYYDQVDVIAVNLEGPGDPNKGLTDLLETQSDLLTQLLAEVRRGNLLLEHLANEEVPIDDFVADITRVA